MEMCFIRKNTFFSAAYHHFVGLQTTAYTEDEAYQVIGHAEMKAKAVADGHHFLIVDFRNPKEYREAHVPEPLIFTGRGGMIFLNCRRFRGAG